MADPVQARARDERLASALRANLKRRKQLVRARADESADGVVDACARVTFDAIDTAAEAVARGASE